MDKGTIARGTLTVMMGEVRAAHRRELDAMKKGESRPFGLTKKQIEDMAAGHDDGMRNIITALRTAGVLEVEDT